MSQSAIHRARKRIRHLAITGFFEGSARAASLFPNAQPARHRVTRVRDIPYRGASDGSTSRDRIDQAHLLDVWTPDTLGEEGKAPSFRAYHGPPWPIVFYVHGGSFRILSKDTHWLMALAFARRGFLVFNINYRLAPPHAYPAAIEDVCDAFTWMTQHAERYGGDLSRVVLAGESAGANLVTSLAIALSYPRKEPFAQRVFDTRVAPCAVVPACGIFQVSDIMRLARRKPTMAPFLRNLLPDVTAPYIGDAKMDESFELADPLPFFERGIPPTRPLPPFFLPVGTHDPLLPDTRRLGVALRALGATAEERYYPGEVHAFHAFVMRKAARQCWADTYEFLNHHVPGSTAK